MHPASWYWRQAHMLRGIDNWTERSTTMACWRICFDDAGGRLDGFADQIRADIDDARQRAELVMPPVAVEVVVQATSDWVIPETGYVGHTPSATEMRLKFDPDNAALQKNMGEPIARMVAHELHHVHRWRGPGYGERLGETLASEGLAGQFCKQLYRSPPELWESAVNGSKLVECARAALSAWDSDAYDHFRWYFGWRDLPRWTGYSLGYAMVGRYIENSAGISAATLAHEPADTFRHVLEDMVA